MMKRATKAALLSACVFPGAGHVLLKRHLAAALFAGTAALCLYFLIDDGVRKVTYVVEQIEAGDALPDVATLTALMTNQADGAGDRSLRYASTVLLIAWILSIVDAYRGGRVQDRRAG